MSEEKEKTENGSRPSFNGCTKEMSTVKIYKNLFALSLAIVFHYSAALALTNLQSTLNNDGGIGVVSQSVLFTFAIITSFLLPKLFIRRFGCKRTLIISILGYTPYIVANLYPKLSTLIPSAAFLGAGSALLWSSVSTYVNNLGLYHAGGDVDKAETSTAKFFGIFLMFYQSTQIWGNMVSYFVLREFNANSSQISTADASENALNGSNLFCGVNYCGVPTQKLKPTSDEKRLILVAIYFALPILAAVILAFFMDNLKERDCDGKESVISKLAATMKLLRKPDQLLLVVITYYIGLEQGFIFGDYSEAYVACAWGLPNIGLVFVCFGVINAVMSISAGYLVTWVPRIVLMVTAATSNVAVCIALLTWEPNSKNPLIFFILVGFWGLSDGIWQTQISAVYGIIFREDEEAAFANHRLWEALGFLTAFSLSNVLCTATKIYMQLAFVLFGIMGYTAVEMRTFWKKKHYPVTTPNDVSKCTHI